MSKLFLITFIFTFFSLVSFSQDVVYDSIRGDKTKWFRIKGGAQEDTTLLLMYENLGILSKSKVLVAAGFLDGLVENIHFKTYSFDYDTITYEFKTDEPINCIVYRYFLNDTTCRYFVGFRKASLGADMFDGQYMFISPLWAPESIVKIYNGIGINRELVFILKTDEIDDSYLNDYQLTNEITIQGIKISNRLRSSKTEDYITYINENFYNQIEIWPIPVDNILNIYIPDNPGVMVRIYSVLPTIKYQNIIESEIIQIDMSNYNIGMYFLIITDYKSGVLLRTIRFIKI